MSGAADIKAARGQSPIVADDWRTFGAVLARDSTFNCFCFRVTTTLDAPRLCTVIEFPTSISSNQHWLSFGSKRPCGVTVRSCPVPTQLLTDSEMQTRVRTADASERVMRHCKSVVYMFQVAYCDKLCDEELEARAHFQRSRDIFKILRAAVLPQLLRYCTKDFVLSSGLDPM